MYCGPSRAKTNPRPALCGAHSFRHRSKPGHSIAAVRGLKRSPWATAGGKGPLFRCGEKQLESASVCVSRVNTRALPCSPPPSPSCTCVPVEARGRGRAGADGSGCAGERGVCGFLADTAVARVIQKGTRVLISLWDSLMFGRVPKFWSPGAAQLSLSRWHFFLGCFFFFQAPSRTRILRHSAC